MRIILVLSAIALLLFGGTQLYARISGDTPGEAVPEKVEDSLVEARARIDAGEEDKARALLNTAASDARSPDARVDALLMQAELAERNGEDAAALALLETVTRDYSGNPRHPEAALRYARMLEKMDRFDDALTVYEAVRAQAPAEYRAEALNGLGRKTERDDAPVEARKLYAEALGDAEPGTKAWQNALDALGRLNVTLAFAPAETPESKFNTIESGDSLTRIGMKLNTTQGLLERANGIDDPSRLRLGQRLKYTPKDFRVVIERSTCQLYLLDADGLFKRYSVGLGMPGYETTLGKYTIGNKQKDPTWFKPGGGPVPPNDPENELGTRWMPLVPADEDLPTDLGIHGTIAPETIGQYKSHGCPRLRKEEVEELYDLIVRSTPVEIVEKIDWQQLG